MNKYFQFILTAASTLVFYSCTSNHVQEDSALKQYFDQYKVDGCFGLFDNGTGEFKIYQLAKYRDSAVTPASTFKIVNSLIGLETGIIANDSSMLQWDGHPYRSECDTSLRMRDAFKLSCLNWYQQLARTIGKEKMQHYLDTLGYAARKGTFKITGPVDSFWLNNSAKVTADEQLGMVKQLYFEKLPFQKRTQKIVRKMMLQEDNANYTLSYKTGLGKTEDGRPIGWIIGWVEENQHPYFFTLMIDQAATGVDVLSIRTPLLKDILKHYGFLEGRK